MLGIAAAANAPMAVQHDLRGFLRAARFFSAVRKPSSERHP
jgi:hypothetical protein